MQEKGTYEQLGKKKKSVS